MRPQAPVGADVPGSRLPERLQALARQSPWMMQALRAARSLELQSWCIGAGAVRNLVWDHLHDKAEASQLADVDLTYFDAAQLEPGPEQALQARLVAICPSLPWEVCNQARVHLWFEAHFGHAVEPLGSLEEAVASWPEYATAVGLWLDDDDAVHVIAPHGLDDLFGCIVRRNPRRVSLATYGQRVREKRYAQRWPRVTVLP